MHDLVLELMIGPSSNVNISVERLYMTSYFMAIIKFPLDGTICKNFENQIKFQTFALETEDQCERREKQDLLYSTGCVAFHIVDFFRILAMRQHTFTKKDNAHTQLYTRARTHTHAYTARDCDVDYR